MDEDGMIETVPHPVPPDIARQPTAPDGGWGWVVLLGSFVSFLIADGWSYSFGVLFPEIVEYFDESRGMTSLVGTLLYAIPMIVSPLACALVATYGCRTISILGGAITGLSLALAMAANSISLLCLIVGIFAGVGLAMVYVSSFIVVTIYFHHRRGLATSLAVTGSGIGALVFPPLIEQLIEVYAWRGTMLIAGGICLNLAVAGTVYRPLVLPSTGKKHYTNGINNDKIDRKHEPSCLKKFAHELCQILGSMCDRKSLKSFPFLIFCVSNFILYLWISMPYVYLVDCALLINNVTAGSAALLLSLAGIGRIFGQILFGLTGDTPCVSASVLYGVGAMVAGFCTLLVPVVAHTYPALAVYATVFGASASVSYVLPMICLVELLGLVRAVNAFGILQLVQGVATLLGTPVAGWLFDVYSSYGASFYMAGALMMMAGLILLPIPWILKRRLAHTHNRRAV